MVYSTTPTVWNPVPKLAEWIQGLADSVSAVLSGGARLPGYIQPCGFPRNEAIGQTMLLKRKCYGERCAARIFTDT